MDYCVDCENNSCAACGDYSHFGPTESQVKEADAALQRLLDEEEEIERKYRAGELPGALTTTPAVKANKPKRFVIHATRVTTSGWGERVTQIPLFYIDGNVQGCRSVEEALKIARIILPDDDVTTDSAHRTIHHIAAFEL